MPPKNIYRSRKVVSCKYCFYEKNDECQLRVCPYVAERITAKVINYEKLILEFFKGNQPRLFSTRLRKHCRTYRHFSYLSTSHRKLFEQTRDEIGNDIIAGTFFLAGDTRSGDLCSLTQDQLQRFGELFAKPETFQPGEVEDALRIEFYSM